MFVSSGPYNRAVLEIDQEEKNAKDKAGIKRYNSVEAFFVWLFSWAIGSGVTSYKYDNSDWFYFNTNSVINWIDKRIEKIKTGKSQDQLGGLKGLNQLTDEEKKKFTNELAAKKINDIFNALNQLKSAPVVNPHSSVPLNASVPLSSLLVDRKGSENHEKEDKLRKEGDAKDKNAVVPFLQSEQDIKSEVSVVNSDGKGKNLTCKYYHEMYDIPGQNESFYSEIQGIGISTGIFKESDSSNIGQRFKAKFVKDLSKELAEDDRDPLKAFKNVICLIYNDLVKAAQNQEHLRTNDEEDKKNSWAGSAFVVCYIDTKSRLIFTATLGKSEASIYRKDKNCLEDIISRKKKSMALFAKKDEVDTELAKLKITVTKVRVNPGDIVILSTDPLAEDLAKDEAVGIVRKCVAKVEQLSVDKLAGQLKNTIAGKMATVEKETDSMPILSVIEIS